MTQTPIRVLVIDDSLLIRQIFTKLLNEATDIEVIGEAVDPYDAREKIKELNPDVVTLDIEMPKMDGLSFLDKIMTLRPMPVVMASTLTQRGAEATMKALELGAVEIIGKPTGNIEGDAMNWLRQELHDKVRAASKAVVKRRKPANQQTEAVQYRASSNAEDWMIAIGSSTGGVEALREVFARLPANLPPIVITQHMPAQFTAALADRLDKLGPVTVQEARHGLRLLPGNAYIAPGDQHLVVSKQGSMRICRLQNTEPVSGHKPSVDVLMHSVAAAASASAIGIMLTGMGRDGAQGLLAMRQAGAHTIGQNEASCVVYGMPRAAMQAGAVTEEVTLTSIAQHIVNHLPK